MFAFPLVFPSLPLLPSAHSRKITALCFPLVYATFLIARHYRSHFNAIYLACFVVSAFLFTLPVHSLRGDRINNLFNISCISCCSYIESSVVLTTHALYRFHFSSAIWVPDSPFCVVLAQSYIAYALQTVVSVIWRAFSFNAPRYRSRYRTVLHCVRVFFFFFFCYSAGCAPVPPVFSFPVWVRPIRCCSLFCLLGAVHPAWPPFVLHRSVYALRFYTDCSFTAFFFVAFDSHTAAVFAYLSFTIHFFFFAFYSLTERFYRSY